MGGHCEEASSPTQSRTRSVGTPTSGSCLQSCEAHVCYPSTSVASAAAARADQPPASPTPSPSLLCGQLPFLQEPVHGPTLNRDNSPLLSHLPAATLFTLPSLPRTVCTWGSSSPLALSGTHPGVLPRPQRARITKEQPSLVLFLSSPAGALRHCPHTFLGEHPLLYLQDTSLSRAS